MTEINNKIIKMIEENKSLKEISILLGLSEKQVYVRIRQIINYGYQVISRYSYNADIYYKIWSLKYGFKI